MSNPKIKKTDFGVFVMVDDTHLSRWVERDGRLDNAHQYLEQFHHLVPEGGTVVDCGTCIGDHTVTYASWVGPNGKVLGFEANPDVAECCALNLGIYPWARVINVGLSDEQGVAGIEVSPNVGASKISNGVAENIVHTKLDKLDNYAEEVDRCDFVKIDVEGYEAKLLDGGKSFISKYKPAILMEINQGCLFYQGYTPSDIYSRLQKLGYAWKVVDGKFGTPLYDILATPL
jgi:FkbM family methyltransferase